MTNKTIIAAALGAVLAAGCATQPKEGLDPAIVKKAEDVYQASYKNLDADLEVRIHQDTVQKMCSEAQNDLARIPDATLRQVIVDQRAALRYPPDNKFMGDWKEGEKLAQDGYGMRMRDIPTRRGGNCYACHQGSHKEVAYGTLGPSLQNFGAQRGNSLPIQRYVYEKIYNSHVFFPCSQMPRFGHNGILTPQQITHLVAWLLDSESPVNKK